MEKLGYGMIMTSFPASPIIDCTLYHTCLPRFRHLALKAEEMQLIIFRTIEYLYMMVSIFIINHIHTHPTILLALMSTYSITQCAGMTIFPARGTELIILLRHRSNINNGPYIRTNRYNFLILKLAPIICFDFRSICHFDYISDDTHCT